MNIHIVPDEKFIDTFIEIAEGVSPAGNNVFLVRDKGPFKYIKSTSKSVVEAPVDSAAFNEIIDKVTPADLVHIHYLSTAMCEWLLRADCKARFTWLFWGSEFYESAGVVFDLYEPVTLLHNETINKNREKLSRFWLLHKYRRWKHEQKLAAGDKERRGMLGAAIAKLSYILHYNRLDYDLIRKHFPTNAQYHYFTYPPPYNFTRIDEMIADVPNPLQVQQGDLNCWLGNSGFPANNHMDYLSKMGKMGIKNLKVWTSLNYGDADYIQHIIQFGHLQLPGQFHAITDYMPFDGFMKAIHSMEVSIMPHKRPQAFGNIQLLLYFGKKVFMDDNTLYRFLIDQGYHIFSVKEMTKEELSTPLSEAQQVHNRKLMDEQFSKDVSAQHIARCLQL